MDRNRVALVTGASSGIGSAVAARLAAGGYKVAVNYHRNREGAESTVAAIVQAGGEAMPVQADVTKAADTKALTAKILAAWGRIDVLVNNAGDIVGRQGLREMTEDFWDQVLDINLKSAFLCVSAVWQQMVARGEGCIINVSSVSARNGGGPGAAAYAAAKGGLLVYTKALAKELAPLGVRVNGVAPGLIMTPFHRNSTPETIQKWVTGIPFGRAGTPEEVASVVGFLASAEAIYIHGETIEINGGMWMD